MSQEAVEQVTEEAAEAAVDQVAEAAEPAPTPEQLQEEIDGRFAALRRHERQLTAKEKQLEERLADIEKRSAELDEFLGAFRKEPDKAWEKAAERAGMTPDEYLERVVERKMSGGKPSEKELWEELQHLRQELAEKERKQAEELQKAQEEAQSRQIQNAVAAATTDWTNHLLSDDGSKNYPHLSGLKKEAMETRIASAMWWAVQNPTVQLSDIMSTLDKMVEEEYAPYVERLKGARGQGDPVLSGEDPGELRAPVKKPTASSSKTISNVDQSVRSGQRRPMTREERLAAAARAIPD